jgi:hypothetical protein
MMKKYLIIALLTLMLAAFADIALAERITVQQEVSQEKQQDSLTSSVVKENRLSSKKIKDKMNATSTDFKGTDKERRMKYMQFKDGEGEVKTKK